MQVAIVIGCLSLAFNLMEQRKRVATSRELSNRTEAQLQRTDKLLAWAHTLRDQAKEQVARAQQRLADA